jgi:hypothetical protein
MTQEEIEKRIEALELKCMVSDVLLNSLVLACDNLIKRNQKLEDQVQGMIVDSEADGNQFAKDIINMKDFQVKLGKFGHALDAKITAVATILCRSLNIDPDDFIREYHRVYSDVPKSDAEVDNLIEETKTKPKDL